MGSVVQVDILYLENLLIAIEENDIPDNKIEQLKGIIRYAKLTESRLKSQCERCPLNKPIKKI
jgi:hypothetical protein